MSNLSKVVVAGDDFITETVLTGLSRTENLSNYCIVAQNEKRCEELKHKYNTNATTDLNFISNANILILTFKFKDAKDMFSSLVGKISENALLISIVPSIALKFINNFFPNNQIVRLTLNPSVISGEGLAAYVPNDKATEESKSIARDMLSSFGKIVEVNNEDEFEKVRKFIFANTFFSYIVVKSMVTAAQKIGFSKEQAGLFIDQMLKGASSTLIKLSFEGGEMLKDGLKNIEFTNRANELIKEYGIYDSMERYLTRKEFKSLFEAYDEGNKSNFHVSYNWFDDIVNLDT